MLVRFLPPSSCSFSSFIIISIIIISSPSSSSSHHHLWYGSVRSAWNTFAASAARTTGVALRPRALKCFVTNTAAEKRWGQAARERGTGEESGGPSGITLLLPGARAQEADAPEQPGIESQLF
eukprot:3899492-Pyramimonas_sp.AAC.1